MLNGLSKKERVILYRTPVECCGCGACYAICPLGAISMRADTEGFFYPVIDDEKCVCCYKCKSVCGFQKGMERPAYPNKINRF